MGVMGGGSDVWGMVNRKGESKMAGGRGEMVDHESPQI